MQPLYVAVYGGVGILLAQCPVVVSERGVGPRVGFSPGHESFCFGIRRTCPVYFVRLVSFACFLLGLSPLLPFLSLHSSQTLGDELSGLDVPRVRGSCEPCLSSSLAARRCT